MDDGKDVVQLLAEIEDEEEGRELELDVVGVVVQPANKNKLLNKINDFFFIIISPFKTL